MALKFNVGAPAASGTNYVQKIRVTAGTTAGSAKITVATKSGKTATLTITVPKLNCTSITAKSSYTVSTLSTIKLGVKLNPVYSDNTITYTSANKKIATVTKAGVVKGIKAGKTTITVKSGTKSVKITVTVKPKTKSITTAKTAYTVKVKKTVSLGAKKVPSNSAEAITYKSSNTKIATVTAKGVVKGIKKGKVTITIKSGSVTKKVTVTVK